MKIKVETEAKYYCKDSKHLVKIAESLGFKEKEHIKESDEYFTDIDSNYILNRTCLRIRKTNNEQMEITFKGKSNALMGSYCKLENNIKSDISQYNDFVKLFSSMGFYTYADVVKERVIYSLNNDLFEYNIMLDTLKDVGGFVEFEIISNKENSNKNDLINELNTFVSKFSELKFKEATKPYRDIAAEHIYNTFVKSSKIENLYINIDSEIKEYQENFFNKYSMEINKIYGKEISYTEFAKTDDNKLLNLIEDYIDNLLFDSNSILVTVALLKKININNIFITKMNKSFFNHLLKKLNINLNSIVYLNDDMYKDYLSNISEENIIIDEDNIKYINSILLIIINNM